MKHASSTKQIAIVGAGIMGRLLAWQLINRPESVTVTLFDKDPIDNGGAAAYTAAGMLAPYSELESAEFDVFEMGMASLARWPAVLSSINATVHPPLTLFSGGTLVVAHQQDMADFQRFYQHLVTKLPSVLLDDSAAHMQVLQQAQLQLCAPQLATRFNNALYLPNEAWLDTNQVMQGLATYLQANGVHWQANCHVSKIENITKGKHAGRAAVHLPSAKQVFDHVIDCRGLGAKRDFATQKSQQLRGVRGEVITLHAPDVTLKHAVRLIHPRYKLYIAPRDAHHFVIGASQIESEDQGPISVRSTLELLSAAYSIDAGFAEAKILNCASNCRPAFTDNLPEISCNKRVMQINGLFRHGYLLAPYLAQQACERLFSRAQALPFSELIQEVS